MLQQIRQNSPCFNAALLGFVEGHRNDDIDKNRLCSPNPYARSVEGWPRLMGITWAAERRSLREPDLSAWVAPSRLNLLRALPDHAAEPAVQTSLQRHLRTSARYRAARGARRRRTCTAPRRDTGT